MFDNSKASCGSIAAFSSLKLNEFLEKGTLQWKILVVAVNEKILYKLYRMVFD